MNHTAIPDVLDLLSSFCVPMTHMLFPHKESRYITRYLECFEENELFDLYRFLIGEGLIGADIEGFHLWSIEKLNLYKFRDDECFYLTEKGGEKWESFFNPDWMKFVGILIDDYDFMSELDLINVELWTPSKDSFNEMIKPFQEDGIVLNIDFQLPWKPAYWKTISDMGCFYLNQNFCLKQQNVVSRVHEIASELASEFCPSSRQF